MKWRASLALRYLELRYIVLRTYNIIWVWNREGGTPPSRAPAAPPGRRLAPPPRRRRGVGVRPVTAERARALGTHSWAPRQLATVHGRGDYARVGVHAGVPRRVLKP